MKEARRTLLGAITAASAGGLLWVAACRIDDVREPWDGSSYPVAYAAALLVSATIGYLWPRGAPIWGAVIIVMQLPVMMAGGGQTGPLLAVGLLILVALAIPAAASAGMARVTGCATPTSWHSAAKPSLSESRWMSGSGG